MPYFHPHPYTKEGRRVAWRAKRNRRLMKEGKLKPMSKQEMRDLVKDMKPTWGNSIPPGGTVASLPIDRARTTRYRYVKNPIVRR